MAMFELTTIYRQQQEEFIHLLGAIRSKEISGQGLNILNKRFLPQFQPNEDDFVIYLTSTNALADKINRERLEASKTRPYHLGGCPRIEATKVLSHQNLIIDGEMELIAHILSIITF